MVTKVDPELLAIYAGSDYRVVVGPGESFVMHIHVPCPSLRELLRREAVATAVFVSAYNPRSEPRTEAENQGEQARLRQEVTAMGLTFYEGIGEDPGGQCAGEPCLLVLGISRDDALALGRRYGQNAAVWALQDGIPQLLLMR